MFILKLLLFVFVLIAFVFIAWMCTLNWKKIGKICLIVIAASGVIYLVLFVINLFYFLFSH